MDAVLAIWYSHSFIYSFIQQDVSVCYVSDTCYGYLKQKAEKKLLYNPQETHSLVEEAHPDQLTVLCMNQSIIHLLTYSTTAYWVPTVC